MADGRVPQFPGKGGNGAAGKPGPTQSRPGWQNAMCPFLTAGEIARRGPDQLVVPAGAQKPEAIKAQPCQGPACMLFVGMKMADGSEQAGCAPVHMFGQLMTLNQQVNYVITAMRNGAAAEAAAATGEPAPNAPDVLPAPSPLTDAADEAAQE